MKMKVPKPAFNKADLKKHLIRTLPYVPVFWFFAKLAQSYRISAAADKLTKSVMALSGLGTVLSKNPLAGLHMTDILWGAACAALIRLIVYIRGKTAKKYRHGREYGSARWGTEKDIRPFIDPKFENNILLTQTERIMIGRNRIPKYNINKNVLVIGGSGSGKTRFHVKPNLMQMNGSYIVTDPKGYILVGQL